MLVKVNGSTPKDKGVTDVRRNATTFRTHRLAELLLSNCPLLGHQRVWVAALQPVVDRGEAMVTTIGNPVADETGMSVPPGCLASRQWPLRDPPGPHLSSLRNHWQCQIQIGLCRSTKPSTRTTMARCLSRNLSRPSEPTRASSTRPGIPR